MNMLTPSKGVDRIADEEAPLWLPIAVCIVIGAAVMAAFFPALFAGFLAWDDFDVLRTHDHYHAFTIENLRWMATATLNGHWMPLTWISYTIDYAIWGMNARGFHLTNMLIHAVNSMLVYLLAARLIAIARGMVERGQGGDRGAIPVRVHLAAAFAALVFAVHPLRTESVAWITERRDVLSAMFLLAAALAYLRAFAPGRAAVRSYPWYIASILLLALSLLGKAWGMSFFIVLMAMDWYPLRRLPFSPFRWFSGDALTVLIQKTPYAVLGLFTLRMAAHAVESVLSPKTLAEWGIVERIVQAFYGLFFYVRSTVWPSGLSPLYQLPRPLNPWEPRFIAAYVFVAGLAVFLWVFRKRWPAVVAAFGVYCVTVAPVLGVNQSGEQFVADRYSYLACIGLVIVAAAGLLILHEKLAARRATAKALLPAAGAVIVLALAMLTFTQTTHWQNTRKLWEYALTVTPTAVLHMNYGALLIEEKDTQEGIRQLEISVAKDPRRDRAWFMLANEYRALGQYDKAEHAYKQVIENSPLRYTAMVNLGSMYMRQLNRPDEAIALFREAVADIEKGGRRSISALPYLALGDALRRRGDIEGARQAFTKALAFEETRKDAERELQSLGK